MSFLVVVFPYMAIQDPSGVYCSSQGRPGPLGLGFGDYLIILNQGFPFIMEGENTYSLLQNHSKWVLYVHVLGLS